MIAAANRAGRMEETASAGKIPAKLTFRVFAEDAKVFLMLDAANGKKTDVKSRVEVARPVTRTNLAEARVRLARDILEEIGELPENEEEALAKQEIDAVLAPLQSNNLLDRARHVVRSSLIVLFQILFGLVIMSIPYKGVEYSEGHLPGWLHTVVLNPFRGFPRFWSLAHRYRA